MRSSKHDYTLYVMTNIYPELSIDYQYTSYIMTNIYPELSIGYQYTSYIITNIYPELSMDYQSTSCNTSYIYWKKRTTILDKTYKTRRNPVLSYCLWEMRLYRGCFSSVQPWSRVGNNSSRTKLRCWCDGTFVQSVWSEWNTIQSSIGFQSNI